MARILLAEDDDALRRVLARTLIKAGHHVAAVEDGRAALTLLRADLFHLLVTDVVMPEMDGISLAREARALYPDLRVMFITGFAAVAFTPRTLLPARSTMVSKPFHLRAIVDAVDAVLV